MFKYTSLSEQVYTQTTVLGIYFAPLETFLSHSLEAVLIYFKQRQSSNSFQSLSSSQTVYIGSRRLRLHRIGKGLGHPIEGVQRLWKEWGPSLCSMVSQARHFPKFHSFPSEAEARPVGGRSCRLSFNFSANTGTSRSLLKEIRDTPSVELLRD